MPTTVWVFPQATARTLSGFSTLTHDGLSTFSLCPRPNSRMTQVMDSVILFNVRIMSFQQGVKLGIQYRILNVCFDFFQPTLKSDLKEVQFTQNYLFWVNTTLLIIPWRRPTWPLLKNITITNIQNSTLNFSFDVLSKWHDPDITLLDIWHF